MAYNSYFPVGYQPMYPYQQNPQFMPQMSAQEAQNNGGGAIPQPQQNQPQNSLIWVQGEAGAKAYPVAPNQTVQLWDSESQSVYLKSADATGMPSMKILDYTIRGADKPGNPLVNDEPDMSIYVTREELEKRLKALKRRSNEDE